MNRRRFTIGSLVAGAVLTLPVLAEAKATSTGQGVTVTVPPVTIAQGTTSVDVAVTLTGTKPNGVLSVIAINGDLSGQTQTNEFGHTKMTNPATQQTMTVAIPAGMKAGSYWLQARYLLPSIIAVDQYAVLTITPGNPTD